MADERPRAGPVQAPRPERLNISRMSNRERVIELVQRLPADTPLEEIAREVELLAGLKKAREQARENTGLSVEHTRDLLQKWVSR